MRAMAILCVLTAVLVPSMRTTAARAEEIRGQYLENRTCQVYTGPCFANAETGLAGKDAVMAWNIQEGTRDGIDLAGLKVVVAVHADETLGFRGIDDAKTVKSVILVDGQATDAQHEALVAFAREKSGRVGESLIRRPPENASESGCPAESRPAS